MKRLLALLALASSCTVFAADLYVDGAAGKDSNPGTKALPYQSPWKGWISAKPGDTVHLLPTITYGNIWLSRNAGTPTAPITIRGAGPARTKVLATGGKEGIMADLTSYVRIENFDVVTTGATTRSAHGIWVKSSHHVEVINNRVKADCSGIQTTHADWITIHKNEVYDSAKRTLQQIWCSGISTHENLDSDTDTTSYKYVITDNVVYGTLNVAEPNCVKCTNSDGSGIIIDDSQRTQTDNNAYKGRHLIANNLLYNNGGRGVTIYLSDNTDTFNNTMHFNNTDPAEGAWRPGEITIEGGGNHRVMYNILSSDGLKPAHTDQHVGVHVSNTTGVVEIGRNLFWNPQGDHSATFYSKNNKIAPSTANHNRFAPPNFVKASIDPAVANFKVKSSSGAKAMPAVKGLYHKVDIDGKKRGTKTLSAGVYR